MHGSYTDGTLLSDLATEARERRHLAEIGHLTTLLLFPPPTRRESRSTPPPPHPLPPSTSLLPAPCLAAAATGPTRHAAPLPSAPRRCRSRRSLTARPPAPRAQSGGGSREAWGRQSPERSRSLFCRRTPARPVGGGAGGARRRRRRGEDAGGARAAGARHGAHDRSRRGHRPCRARLRLTTPAFWLPGVFTGLHLHLLRRLHIKENEFRSWTRTNTLPTTSIRPACPLPRHPWRPCHGACASVATPSVGVIVR